MPEALRAQAASRLIASRHQDPVEAGRRFVSGAVAAGIDLSLMWGTFDRHAGRPVRAREVVLLVPGSGGTAMCFLSEPDGALDPHRARSEREAVIRAAVGFAQLRWDRRVVLVQALPETGEAEAIRAFLDAGFIRVGDLDYLRLSLTDGPVIGAPGPCPDSSFEVRPVRSMEDGQPDLSLVMTAMERSYEDTLDCPELCGLRQTRDVVESHRSAGVWSPQWWYLVLREGQAEECMLLNPFPDQRSIELVYLGLSLREIGRAHV